MPTWWLTTANDDSQRLGRRATMPEENTATVENATQGAPAEPERTFTQAEMDAIIGDRLKRERAKYADYDELAQKAKAYDEAEEANKSELQKAVEERDKLKAELDKLEAERERAELVAKVAAEKGVDAALLSRMEGDVEENAEFLASRPKYEAVHDSGEKNVQVKPPEIPKFF